MLACIASILVYYLFFAKTSPSDCTLVFWLESVAVWAFGISWLVKGETILTD